MLMSNIPHDVPRAEGILVGKSEAATTTVPTTIAHLDGEWRLYVYPFDRAQALNSETATQALGDAEPHVASGRDGWIVLQAHTPDDVLSGIRSAGYPVHRTTAAEIKEQAEAWAKARLEYDDAIGRGEVDW